jgi:hypothetical protein
MNSCKTRLILNIIIVTRKVILPMNVKNKLKIMHMGFPNIKHKLMWLNLHLVTFNCFVHFKSNINLMDTWHDLGKHSNMTSKRPCFKDYQLL